MIYKELTLQPEVERNRDLAYSEYASRDRSIHVLLQEQFYLALAMKPLCRGDCRGLCSRCGANLNEEACDCGTAWEDPRLALLRGLGKTRDA